MLSRSRMGLAPILEALAINYRDYEYTRTSHPVGASDSRQLRHQSERSGYGPMSTGFIILK